MHAIFLTLLHINSYVEVRILGTNDIHIPCDGLDGEKIAQKKHVHIAPYTLP
jgi:hypothetical protein